jgi:hypothetical protein
MLDFGHDWSRFVSFMMVGVFAFGVALLSAGGNPTGAGSTDQNTGEPKGSTLKSRRPRPDANSPTSPSDTAAPPVNGGPSNSAGSTDTTPKTMQTPRARHERTQPSMTGQEPLPNGATGSTAGGSVPDNSPGKPREHVQKTPAPGTPNTPSEDQKRKKEPKPDEPGTPQ